MKRLFLSLAVVTSLLLPSCSTVTWNIGERIRNSGEQRVGVDGVDLWMVSCTPRPMRRGES